MSDELEKALAFLRRSIELTADEVHRFEHGWIFKTPSIRGSWTLNHVRIGAPIDLGTLLDIVEREQADLHFRRITFEPTGFAKDRGAELLSAGWRIERDQLMVLSAPADRSVDTSSVVDVSEADHLELGRMWSREEVPEAADGVLDELVRFWRRESQARGDRFLGIRDPDDQAVLAKTKLRCAEGVAQVEDVYTVPHARGRGLGRTLVTRAVELAEQSGHELIFIVADDDDWPKQLYEQIGFRPVGRLVHALRVGAPAETQSRRRMARQSG